MFARTSKRSRPSAMPPRATTFNADQGVARPAKEQFSKDKIIHASERCTAEKVSSFPKEIRDILRGSDTSSINGKFDASGIGFLIIQNIVYVWDVTSGMKTTKFNPPLSQKDLLPDLVTIVRMENKVGLAVCSPDGVVRVWPTLNEPNTYWDSSLRIHSEPSYITYIDPYGVVVGTQGGAEVNLYMVSMNPVQSKPFKTVSSSWFGYILGTTRYTSVSCLIPGARRSNYTELYVLTELTLQKWEIYSNTERMQQELPINAWLKDSLMRSDNSEFIVTLQDAKFANEGILYVLASCYLAYCPIDADRTVSYQILSVRLEGSSMEVVQHFEVPVGKPPLYNDAYESISPRLAIPNFHSPANNFAYVCLEDSIILLQGASPEEISFPGDKILALGTFKKSAYVVAEKLGCVKFNVNGQLDSQAQSPTRIYTQQLVQIPTNSKDILFHATKAHSSGDKQKAFQYAAQIGSELSDLVVQMSKSILDNAPFSESDPQWTDATNSMFLRKQIDAKKFKHTSLTDFLKDQDNGLSLWANLAPMAQLIVEENGEKLVAALNLRTAQTSEGDVNRESLIQRAIKRTLDERRVEHIRSAITAQEIYYSEVSTMDEILGPVYDSLLSAKPATSHANLDHSIAEFREANQIYLAFFSALSPATLSIQRTHFKTRQLALKNLGHKYLLLAREFLRLELGENEKELYQQIFTLTRAILSAFAYEAESGNEGSRVQYVQAREELLRTFLPSHRDLAMKLAEEFLDFHILLLICTERQDKQRIYDYMHQFSKEGFPEFVFDNFYKNNRYDELMSLPSDFSEQLMNYLRPYPALSWLQFLHCQKYMDASNALKQANEEEKESLGRKKVLLSLAKLSGLANSATTVDRRLEQQMYMLRLQKTILPNQTKPLEPKELVHSILYTSHAPVIQNVLSALDAAKNSDTLIPSESRQQLIELIWYFALEHGLAWNSVINDWKNGRIEDIALRQAIEGSVIFGAAQHPNNAGLFPHLSMTTVFKEWLNKMIESRPNDDPALLARLLQTIHDSILSLPACSQ